jgi:L-lactate dehydrogenase complex protein LldG
MTSQRAEFLARVRQAAITGARYRIHDSAQHRPASLDGRNALPTAGYVGVEGDLSARMVAEVNAAGGQGRGVRDFAAAGELISKLIQTEGVHSALCWRHPVLDRLQLADLLRSRNVAMHDYESLAALDEPARRTATLAADLGITSCDLAVAETGTLVMCARPGRERSASLLPRIHVAIITAEQIVPDLIDAFASLEADGEPPSNVTLITGPSKTGDIELELTTGVHGPGKWHVIVVGGE